MICHGIPGDKVLKSGDSVNLDITVIKNGYHGDTSRMFLIGEPSILTRRLSEITFECMWLGIDKIKPGAHLGDIGHVIQQHAEKAGYSIVREFCGHGIGKVFHEEPQVLHYGRPGTLERLEAGMIFTVEPMLNAGRREIRAMGDGWTIKTKDRSLSAQWEHTAITTASAVPSTTNVPACIVSPTVIVVGVLSPVSNEVSSSNPLASIVSASAGIRSPPSTNNRSPNTTSAASTVCARPSRRTVTRVGNSARKRSAALSARFSCTKENTALIRITPKIAIPNWGMPPITASTPATHSISAKKCTSSPTNRRKSDGLPTVGSRFGPSRSRRSVASTELRPLSIS